jgi:SAM-dependent methyltransferase
MMACPACRAATSKPAFHGPPRTFRRCTACGSLFDTDPPPPEAVKALYEGKDYFVKDDPAAAASADDLWGYGDDYLADQDEIEAKFDRVLARVERFVPVGRLLDVGAGPGFLVAAACRRGWQASGLDLNEWAAEYAQRELGVDVRAGDLADGAFAGEQFDAVTMMDVVEHVSDPDDLLERVAAIVRPGGVVALLTPDAGSFVSRALGRRWPEVRRPGEHMVLFSVRGLSATLARHGLVAAGWHSIGKTAPIATLLTDAGTALPKWSHRLIRDKLAHRRLGKRVVELDPRTKFVLYATRTDAPVASAPVPARIPRRA